MWTRREFLRAGGLGSLGLTLPQLLAAGEKQTGIAPTAEACIILFLNGGPSHLDMWDMKPDGPVDIRGEFAPIPSSLPGVLVSEHLPRLSAQMHHTTLVRSMHHSVNNSHAAAVYAALTGHDRGEFGGGARPSDFPAPGSVLAKLRPPGEAVLPYVALPYKTQEGAGGPLQPGFLGGYIGANYDPFWVLQDPNSPQFQVPNLSLPNEFTAERVNDRNRLLDSLDRRFPRQIDATLDAMNGFQRQAFELLTSTVTREGFDLSRESEETRERYGRNIYGQSTLLARRLIERGTRLITLSWAPHANATWDTHGNNFQMLKNTLLPQFDLACAALIDDLHQRGLLPRTLVAVLGDFGRTPKINGNAGRDHWNNCYTVMLAGGGIREGYVHGQSDRQGATPLTSPVSPGDIVATIYRTLGVDHRSPLYDSLNRPHPIVPEGQVVHSLLG